MRALIYLGLLFIYPAIDFKAALIVWACQDKVDIDCQDVSPRTGQPVDWQNNVGCDET